LHDTEEVWNHESSSTNPFVIEVNVLNQER